MNIPKNPFNFKKKTKAMNDTFIKQLIDSDFIFSKSRTTKQNSKLFNSSINFQDKNQFHILNIFRLNTSLKQYIRLLQFLTESKLFRIYIICKDKYYLNLTQRLVTKLSLEKHFSITSTYPEIRGGHETTKFVFFLGNVEITDNFYSKITRDKTFLITKYNLNIERKLFGFYKIQNELDDYKKLVLLLIIIEKIINK